MNKLSLVPPVAFEQQTDRLAWGVVEFQVTDLARAVAFWTSALGLIDRDLSSDGVALGTKEKTLFILRGGATRPVARAHTGMYHVAMGVRSQAEFSRLLARLIERKVQVAPTDHLMAKSLYLADPDGLEIEITFETPDRFGRFGDFSKGLVMYDVDGRPHSGREPLDVGAELRFAQGADLDAALADDAYLAHLHFKVGGLEPALNWFETLGFERHLTLDSWGFADMGAGAPNTHRLAMNIWSGADLPVAPDDMARLVRYELVALDPEVMKRTRLRVDGDVLRGFDPAGVEVTLRAAAE